MKLKENNQKKSSLWSETSTENKEIVRITSCKVHSYYILRNIRHHSFKKIIQMQSHKALLVQDVTITSSLLNSFSQENIANEIPQVLINIAHYYTYEVLLQSDRKTNSAPHESRPPLCIVA